MPRSSANLPEPEKSNASNPPNQAGATGSIADRYEPTVSLPSDAANLSALRDTGRDAPAVYGRYEVRRSLGSGGYGDVYLGHDSQLDRMVAIKVIRPRLKDRIAEDVLSLQEARKLARLRHPGIVTVHDVGVQEGQVYIVSDFLEGPDLGRWLRETRPSWLESARIIAAVADALAHAHARLIIHRDIKPANIILTTENNPVLVDFGLALGEDEALAGRKGVISGTPNYMSPEQVQGIAHRIDGRTDIYSLGVTLYESLTGRVPFHASTLSELLRQVCEDDPQPPRQLVAGIAPELEWICLKALAKRQQDRYTTAGDFADELRHVISAATSPTVELPAQPNVASEVSPIATPTSSDTPPSVRLAREAERRQLTVLVCGCDLFESEAYLEMDAEDQARILSAFQEKCEQAVRQFGGTVVQRNEKGLLACFGFPVAYENAGRRAARSGLAILESVKNLNEQFRLNQEIIPWAGIHTGPVLAETKDGAVSLVGEARNVALRLEDVAAPGQVICTEVTNRIFKGRFQCASLGSHQIKGVSHPLELFRVERVVTGSLLETVAPAELSPLTGRDHEISLLKERWEQAQEGMGQVVLLIGEPGLGKSRLVHTMKQHVLAQMVEGEVDSPVIEWRCSPRFQNTRLYPAIDFYERALGIDREDSPQHRFEQLLNRLEAYDLAQPEVVPLWASLLSLPASDAFPPLCLSPVRQREETFRVMLDWLRTRAARKPILFIVEDLHWIDASTLDFLGQFLAEGLHDSILTILTFRPEFQTPWPAVAQQTSLALNRLTRRQAAELMRKKSSMPLPEDLIEQVYERTAGVPLFLEEVTRTILESGALERAPETDTPNWLKREIPATLQDLVMARLERLEGDRDLAQLAATLGREFNYDLVAAVSSLQESALETELIKLVNAEILYQKGRPPRRTYIFKHALLEDALYNAMVKGKRQSFHRQIAEVLEAQFQQTAETRPELLAHHFTEGALTEKAVGYWLKAGIRSREKSANVEAISHLTKGLELLGTLEESPQRDAQELQFLNPLGSAFQASRGYAAAEVAPVFQRSRELCDRVGNNEERFAMIWGNWAHHEVRAQFRRCMDEAAEAMELAEKLADPGMLMEALWMLGDTLFHRADFASARDCFTRALNEYEDRTRTKFWSAYTGQDCGVAQRCSLSLAMWYLGYPDQALQINREMRELARSLGQPRSIAYALHHTAWLYQHCRLGAEALETAEEQIDLAVEQGFAGWRATGTVYRGAALMLQGQLNEALPVFQQGLDAYRAIGAAVAVPYYLSVLAEAFTHAERFDEALNALDEALAIVDKNDDRFQEAELHRLKGELYLDGLGDEAAAEKCFLSASRIAQDQQSKAWELRTSLSLARLWQRQGRREKARVVLAAVFDTYTEGFKTPDLVDAESLLNTLS